MAYLRRLLPRAAAGQAWLPGQRPAPACGRCGHSASSNFRAVSDCVSWIPCRGLRRICGEIAMREDGSATRAEEHFLHSLDWSRRQEALAWELRTATSLARLRKSQRRRQEATDLLAPVYARFGEGLDTADLVSAKALLDELT